MGTTLTKLHQYRHSIDRLYTGKQSVSWFTSVEHYLTMDIVKLVAGFQLVIGPKPDPCMADRGARLWLGLPQLVDST